jgi:K(+)-stimulated pyrophosphate-energized sodium pump
MPSGLPALGALVLFAAYTEDLHHFMSDPSQYPYFAGIDQIDFGLANPYVVIGLLLGGLLPYLFGGIAMTAVGRAAGAVVEEVRKPVPAKCPASCRARRSRLTAAPWTC